jgi:hypothetical protein
MQQQRRTKQPRNKGSKPRGGLVDDLGLAHANTARLWRNVGLFGGLRLLRGGGGLGYGLLFKGMRAVADLGGEADAPTTRGAGSAAWTQPTAMLVQEWAVQVG